MANVKSAEKRIRQNAKRRERNKGNRTLVKTAMQNARSAVQKDPKAAQAVIQATVATVAKAAHHGAIPKRRAARKISRLQKAQNKALANA